MKQVLLILAFLSSYTASAKQALTIHLEKVSSSLWTVEYISQQPIKSISFAITPDHSRHQRWTLMSDGFKFQHVNNSDFITRIDGQLFERVKFQLTPTYTHLPKYYAPFSPYSDGGMLLHSARFFACAELCSPIENSWFLHLEVPENEHVIVDGKVYYGSASWWDKNDGKKVYVGTQVIEDGAMFVGVVDRAINDAHGKVLQDALPNMMVWLAQHYGRLKHKPMLYASYGEATDGSFGTQGGTLPNQVFMHWYGKLPDYQEGAARLIWFFAHEAAHMFQRLSGTAISPVDNWLHEGHAEYLAKQLVSQLYPSFRQYALDKSASANKNCNEKVTATRLSYLIARNNHEVLYQCGLFIFDTISEAISQNDKTRQEKDIHGLWRQFTRNVKPGDKVSGRSFIELAAKEYALPSSNAKKLLSLLH